MQTEIQISMGKVDREILSGDFVTWVRMRTKPWTMGTWNFGGGNPSESPQAKTGQGAVFSAAVSH